MQGRGPPVSQHGGRAGHDGAFPGSPGCTPAWFGGSCLPGVEPAMMGHTTIKQAAPGRQPVPRGLSSPSGNSIFRPIPPGSRLRVPGFDLRPSPVIKWLPGKEGSRRNWLLCLAPLQEVFLLGGTKVRAGWEAFPDSSPRTCARPWQGGRSRPHTTPVAGAAIPGTHRPERLSSARKVCGPLCMRFGGERAVLLLLCETTHLQMFPCRRKEGAVGGSAREWSEQQGLGCGKRFFTLFL